MVIIHSKFCKNPCPQLFQLFWLWTDTHSPHTGAKAFISSQQNHWNHCNFVALFLINSRTIYIYLTQTCHNVAGCDYNAGKRGTACFNSYSASHNWCTATLWNRIMTAQCEGMGGVGSARYEPALLPPCPSIRVLSYSSCQEIHSRQQTGLAV